MSYVILALLFYAVFEQKAGDFFEFDRAILDVGGCDD
jgi:hypothetical protein